MALPTTALLMTRDQSGAVTFGLIPSTIKYNTTLAAGVAQTFTTPSDTAKYLAIFSMEPGASVWCALNTTAAVPGVSVAATSSELNPTSWQVEAGDTISVISPNTTAEIGVKFYAIS
jgi:hypothetical protein